MECPRRPYVVIQGMGKTWKNRRRCVANGQVRAGRITDYVKRSHNRIHRVFESIIAKMLHHQAADEGQVCHNRRWQRRLVSPSLHRVARKGKPLAVEAAPKEAELRKQQKCVDMHAALITNISNKVSELVTTKLDAYFAKITVAHYPTEADVDVAKKGEGGNAQLTREEEELLKEKQQMEEDNLEEKKKSSNSRLRGKMFGDFLFGDFRLHEKTNSNSRWSGCQPDISEVNTQISLIFTPFLLLWPLHVYPHKHPLNFIFLGLFTASLSLTVGVSCANTEGRIMLEALIMTSTVVSAITGYTFWASSNAGIDLLHPK
ncbi:hypothetical protein ACS0TY_032568 [Phlomoides rotata]